MNLIVGDIFNFTDELQVLLDCEFVEKYIELLAKTKFSAKLFEIFLEV
jgi:hypothetical protein